MVNHLILLKGEGAAGVQPQFIVKLVFRDPG